MLIVVLVVLLCLGLVSQLMLIVLLLMLLLLGMLGMLGMLLMLVPHVLLLLLLVMVLLLLLLLSMLRGVLLGKLRSLLGLGLVFFGGGSIRSRPRHALSMLVALLLMCLILLLLGVHSWRIAASILAKIDLELLVLALLFDTLNGLDGIGQVREVDKGT